MRVSDLLFRSWYYFRSGYGTYLSFLVGYGSTLVTFYYLAIRNIPALGEYFSRFFTFVAVATVAIFPLSVAIGWFHVKRSPAWRSEVDIQAEANPYNYKLPPGYYKEVLFPVLRELLVGNMQVLDGERLIDPLKRKRCEELLQKLDILLRGGYVGHPRRSPL